MTTPRYWDPNTSSWVAFGGPQGYQGAQGAQGYQGAQGAQGPQGAFPTTAGGDLTGTYPNPTVAQIRGALVNATAPGNATLMFYNPSGDSAPANQWIPVVLAGDIVQANWPSAVNGPVNYQVRGLYGQAMTGPLSAGTTVRFNGTNLVPSATAGNISNDAMYMNNPAANWTAPTGFSVIGNMSSPYFSLNAGMVYLLIANVTITGPIATIVEVGFGSSTGFGINGWAANGYVQIAGGSYNISMTCWGYIGAGAAAQTVYLCIQTNGPNVIVVRNGINYCTGAVMTALSYGNQ
jgi:hypothetical protein